MGEMYPLMQSINIIVGVAVILYIYRVYQVNSHPYLLSLVLYCIVFNILIFVELAWLILHFQFGINNLHPSYPLISSAQILFQFLFQAGWLYFMLRTILNLMNIPVTGIFKKTIILIFAIFALITLWTIIQVSILQNLEWIQYSNQFIIIISVLGSIGILSYPLLKKLDDLSAIRKKSINHFAILFLLLIMIWTVVRFNFVPPANGSIRLYFSIILIVNLGPLFWMKFSYFLFAGREIAVLGKTVDLNPIKQDFDLTDLELELLEEDLLGKSNLEIGESLSISSGQVKKSRKALLEKMGIENRNRVQDTLYDYYSKIE